MLEIHYLAKAEDRKKTFCHYVTGGIWMKQDLLAKRYYSDNRRFADLINGIVCNGIPNVKQEDFYENDTENTHGKPRERVR